MQLGSLEVLCAATSIPSQSVFHSQPYHCHNQSAALNIFRHATQPVYSLEFGSGLSYFMSATAQKMTTVRNPHCINHQSAPLYVSVPICPLRMLAERASRVCHAATWKPAASLPSTD